MDDNAYAIMEGEMIVAVDEYIAARPQLDSTHNRRIYEAGFRTAWNRRAEDVPEVALYHELLFAVASKFPNESRHQTALRYINSAEHGQTKVGTMLAPEVKP